MPRREYSLVNRVGASMNRDENGCYIARKVQCVILR